MIEFVIGYAVLTAALYALWLTGVFPRVRVKKLYDRNGRNSLFRVEVDPDAPDMLAVLAQEIAEVDWKWRRAHGLPAINLILDEIPALERRMELWGHEVEVQAAAMIYGADPERKRRTEARVMHAYSGYHFDDWTPDEIERAMRDHADDARKWVERNLERIQGAG